MKPVELYEERIAQFESEIKSIEGSMNRIGNGRLGLVALSIVVGVILYNQGLFWLLGGVLAAAFVLFLYLGNEHKKQEKMQKQKKQLLQINETSLSRVNGEWKDFKDTGEEFINPEHSFSYDLDLFGVASLFQWINTTKTFLGRKRIGAYFTNPLVNVDEIKNRQVAVEDLSKKLAWRQEYEALGLLSANKMKDVADLITWGKKTSKLFEGVVIKAILVLFPNVMVLLLLAAFAFNSISGVYPLIMLAINIIVLRFNRQERTHAFITSYAYQDNLKVYHDLLKHIENETFSSPALMALKDRLKNNEGRNSVLQLKKLVRIVDFISNRNNQLYFLVNFVFLLDYHFYRMLMNWKEESGIHLEEWLLVIAEFEALSSLAIIRFDNPEWPFPEIVAPEKGLCFEAVKLGHPLITKGRIQNDVSFKNAVKVLLITGSNMSGKSTLLRTVGFNLIFARMGLCVCAKKFTCSIMTLYTCMRTSDNLSTSVSSFYAEILRIKNILEATERGEQVFFLMDEIFKGTNSYDRNTGATVLITKLAKKNVLGMVSTHDLELSTLEMQNIGVLNHHFQETYKDGRILFDYKLYKGVSTTRNARYLMEMAGIFTE